MHLGIMVAGLTAGALLAAILANHHKASTGLICSMLQAVAAFYLVV
jgi:hypothetical protein